MHDDFLESAGWDNASRVVLSPDFSTRRFTRLIRLGESAIFMEAGVGQKTEEFVRIAALLRAAGLSAPLIFAADAARGLVLMEDFGADGTLGQRLDLGLAGEEIFARGASVLATLHDRFDPASDEKKELCAGLPVFSASALADLTALYLDVYVPFAFQKDVSPKARDAFISVWRKALAFVDDAPRSLLLRDFMPDNLMDLPARAGPACVGLLDFQDGGIGPLAYDLASLAEGVRRPSSLERLDAVLHAYCALRPGVSFDALRPQALWLSAQRHTRVLGIFARYRRFDIVERVEGFLHKLLRESELAPLRQALELRTEGA